MKNEDVKLFKALGETLKKTKEKLVPDSHWKNEAELLRKRIEHNKMVDGEIQMSHKKFVEPFTI